MVILWSGNCRDRHRLPELGEPVGDVTVGLVSGDPSLRLVRGTVLTRWSRCSCVTDVLRLPDRPISAPPMASP
jgi:hypothetical protein